MPVLIDSSAWIEFFHPNGDAGVKRAMAAALEGDDVATVAPVVAELLSGAGTSRQRQTIQRSLSGLRMLPLGWEEASIAGGLRETLARRGRRAPLVDLLIAAAAIHGGFDVWHAGDEHYVTIAGVSGCRVRNVRVTPRA